MADLFAVDVGGTFTDVVVLRDGQLTGRKTPTTLDQADGVALAASGKEVDTFLHGTTVATNTLLQETGAAVTLVTSPGYEDLIEIGRQDRPSLYDSGEDRPPALVAREHRFGSDVGVEEIAARSSESDAVAVGLIEAHLDTSEESALVQELRSRLPIPVVAGSEISPEFREYERLATTVLSAYLTPSVHKYLGSLDERLAMRARLVMTSAGGLVPFAVGARLAGRLVLSGPAGGAVAAASMARHHGLDHVLSFDMGGTSTDVCRIRGGAVSVGREHSVAGRVNRVPSVPIQTIGAGGGSIGWVDAGGALRVGPRSAGAVPGPAAYLTGGTEATVTDANLVAGHIPESLALGGSVALSPHAASKAMSALGDRLGMSVAAIAEGILEVADSHMVHALRSVSINQGADPRTATLVAFGGAGGLHAVRLARELDMKSVMVPPFSGVFSALGLAMAAPRRDLAQTVMLDEGDLRYFQMIRDVMGQAITQYESTFGRAPGEVTRTCDVRYAGQSHELEIDGSGDWADLRTRFEEAHLRRFGFQRQGEPIEVINIRAAATGPAPLNWTDLPEASPDRDPTEENGAWNRDTLPPGFTLDGPGLVTEANSATLVGEGDRLTVLDDGTLEITWR